MRELLPITYAFARRGGNGKSVTRVMKTVCNPESGIQRRRKEAIIMRGSHTVRSRTNVDGREIEVSAAASEGANVRIRAHVRFELHSSSSSEWSKVRYRRTVQDAFQGCLVHGRWLASLVWKLKF